MKMTNDTFVKAAGLSLCVGLVIGALLPDNAITIYAMMKWVLILAVLVPLRLIGKFSLGLMLMVVSMAMGAFGILAGGMMSIALAGGLAVWFTIGAFVVKPLDVKPASG